MYYFILVGPFFILCLSPASLFHGEPSPVSEVTLLFCSTQAQVE